MALTKRDVVSTIRRNKARLQTLGVHRLGLFGSFARSEQKSASDIDLLVEFQAGKKTFDNFMELSFFLEGVLQRRVELVTAESLSPYLAPHILKEVEYVSLAA